MDTEVLCNTAFEHCHCAKLHGHGSPHECECVGSWDDEGTIYHLPAFIIPPAIDDDRLQLAQTLSRALESP